MEQTKQAESKSRLGVYAVAAVATLLLGTWLWSAIATHRLENRREQALLDLAEEPGYWVQGSVAGDHWSGLRDPLARPLEAVLGENHERLDVTWAWKPVQSLDAPIVALRAREILQPPASVSLTWPETGVLRLAGEASTQWIRRAKGLAPGIPGVRDVQWNELVDHERRAIEARVQSLDGLYLPFGNQSSVLDEARPEVIGRLQAIRTLDHRILVYGGVLRLELQSVLGEEEPYDRALASKRLDAVRSALAAQGLQVTIVQARPVPGESGANASRPGVRLGVRAILTDPGP